MNWPANPLRSLAGLLLATAALPAQAQIAPAAMPFYSATKTEAILGGSSALAALLAQQSGITTTQFATPPAPSSRQLASQQLPLLRAPFMTAPTRTFVPATPDRPDVFNSVALPVARTPLDGRWSHVAHSSVGGSAGAYAASLADRPQTARLDAINAYVNHRVEFVDDIRQYGVADRWSLAADTLARGRGDCEDYAIAKMAMLRRAGFAERDLYLVILRDLVRRADHAVLVVRSEGHFRVLDNGTDQVIDSSEVHDYRPMLTFNVAHAYTHGYRREVMPPPASDVAMAMAPAPAAVLPASPVPVLTPASYQSASTATGAWMLPSMLASSAER